MLFAIASLANQMSRAKAYSLINKAGSLAPFLYSSLIFSTIIDWIWLDITPGLNVYLGLGLVIFSGVIMSIRTRPKPSN